MRPIRLCVVALVATAAAAPAAVAADDRPIYRVVVLGPRASANRC